MEHSHAQGNCPTITVAHQNRLLHAKGTAKRNDIIGQQPVTEFMTRIIGFPVAPRIRGNYPVFFLQSGNLFCPHCGTKAAAVQEHDGPPGAMLRVGDAQTVGLNKFHTCPAGLRGRNFRPGNTCRTQKNSHCADSPAYACTSPHNTFLYA